MWGVTYFAHARWKIKRSLAVVSFSGSVGETNCSQGTLYDDGVYTVPELLQKHDFNFETIKNDWQTPTPNKVCLPDSLQKSTSLKSKVITI